MSDQLHGFGVIAAVEKHCEAICFFGAHTKQDAYCTYGLEKESFIGSGQIIATSHEFFTPKGSVLEGKSPYFREI